MVILYIRVTLVVVFILVASYIVLYQKNKKLLEQQENNREKFNNILEKNIKEIDKLTLVGVDGDGNGDYRFVQAVSRIFLTKNTRIRNL